jgi:hypothetical protein
MPQTKNSGAVANRWGLETAKKLIASFGAVPTGRRSNEATLKNERIVIKCAAVDTNSVGVTYQMLERIGRVFGAFELEDGSFEVWSLSSTAYKAAMTPTRSQGASAGKVGIVKKSVFLTDGQLLDRVRV